MMIGYNTYGYDEIKSTKKIKVSHIPSHITNVDFYDKKFLELVKN